MENADLPLYGPALEDAPLGSRPAALILSGGVALGSWQGGVLYAFEKEHGLDFHSVAGTSAGSLNGVAYFQNDTERLKRMWRDVPRGAFMKYSLGLRPPRVYSQDAMRTYLKGFIDEDAVRANPRCWFYVLSTNLRKGLDQAEYSPEPGGPWDGPLLEHVLGSVAVPFLFPPVRIPAKNGAPAKDLMDGHLISFIDLERMAARGVRDFLFVNVASRVSLARPRYSLRGFISTLVDQLLQGQVDTGIAQLRLVAKERGLRAFEFNPRKPLNISVFGFDRKECRRAFDKGVEDARTYLKDPKPFRIL